MHIEHITIENFIGIHFLDAALNAKGVTLIAGHNGAGKSTVRDAIRFALLGEPGRVRLKKDYRSLLTAGTKNGRVTMRLDSDHEIRRNVKTGNPEGPTPALPETLPYVLDADRFARLDEKARRRLLMEITGVSVSRDDVRRRLLTMNCDKDKVDAILPLLRQGFEAAAQEAAGRAREAKGAWRQITGETWGKAKAEGWGRGDGAIVPTVAMNKVKHLEADLATAKRELAKAEAIIERKARLGDLRTKADRIPELEDAVEAAKARAQEASDLVLSLRSRAQAEEGVEAIFSCPHCGVESRVQILADRVLLVDGDMETPPGTQEIAQAMEEESEAIKSLESVRRELADAKAAAEAIAAIDEDHVTEADVEALKDDVADNERRLSEARIIADRHVAVDKADAIHREVLSWLRIADALAPDGIPAELTAQTLEPINARLRDSAGATGWPMVQIDEAMGITIEGRPYALLSESEQWRVDAMIAAAISMQAGIHLLVLDRMDVLDIPSRNVCLRWLAQLAEEHRMQIIVMATLKARPERLMPCVSCIWLEHGATVDAERVAA